MMNDSRHGSDAEENAHTTRTAGASQGRFLINGGRVGLVLLLMLVAAAAWIGSTALQTEERLIAVARTVEKIDTYLQETQGRWPESWEAIFPDTAERMRIRKFVEFDFNATLKEVASAAPDRFTYIRPNGPCSRSYERQVSKLIATAKSFQGE